MILQAKNSKENIYLLKYYKYCVCVCSMLWRAIVKLWLNRLFSQKLTILSEREKYKHTYFLLKVLYGLPSVLFNKYLNRVTQLSLLLNDSCTVKAVLRISSFPGVILYQYWGEYIKQGLCSSLLSRNNKRKTQFLFLII